MLRTSDKINAFIETLSLDKGVYLFSVRSERRTPFGTASDLRLPALHVGAAPGVAEDQLTIMSGPQTVGNWLCEEADMIVVQASRGPATVVLTSLRGDGKAAPLGVHVKRLDRSDALAAPLPVNNARPAARTATLAVSAVRAAAPVVPPTVPPTVTRVMPPPPGSLVARVNEGRRALPAEVTVHIQNKGDTQFLSPEWAGTRGHRLAIESFSIRPVEEVTADRIEYKALTATGIETPWVSDGAPCGTRGMGVALVGFAVRIKSQPGAPLYDCEYSGSFVSGQVSGPFRNGVPCQSISPDDLLEGIQLSIFERQPSASRRPIGAAARPPRRAAYEPEKRNPIRPVRQPS
jgi:hypothetical protein